MLGFTSSESPGNAREMPGLGPVKLCVASATVALLDILSVEKLRHEPKPFAKLELSAFNTIAMSMVSAVQWHNAAYTPEMVGNCSFSFSNQGS